MATPSHCVEPRCSRPPYPRMQRNAACSCGRARNAATDPTGPPAQARPIPSPRSRSGPPSLPGHAGLRSAPAIALPKRPDRPPPLRCGARSAAPAHSAASRQARIPLRGEGGGPGQHAGGCMRGQGGDRIAARGGLIKPRGSRRAAPQTPRPPPRKGSGPAPGPQQTASRSHPPRAGARGQSPRLHPRNPLPPAMGGAYNQDMNGNGLKPWQRLILEVARIIAALLAGMGGGTML